MVKAFYSSRPYMLLNFPSYSLSINLRNLSRRSVLLYFPMIFFSLNLIKILLWSFQLSRKSIHRFFTMISSKGPSFNTFWNTDETLLKALLHRKDCVFANGVNFFHSKNLFHVKQVFGVLVWRWSIF